MTPPVVRRRWPVSPVVVAALALGACRDVACTPQYDAPPSAGTDTSAAPSPSRSGAAFDDSTALAAGDLPAADAPSPDSLPLGARPMPDAPVTPSVTPESPAVRAARRDSLLAAAPRVPVPAGRMRTAQAPGSALVVPVVGTAPADIPDTFADARSEGRVHDAADLMAPRGTAVVAAASGTVARLFVSERGGLTVYILSDVPAPVPVAPPALPGAVPVVVPPDPKTVHYYAHLDAFAAGLAAGQRVAAGQFLGTVGETGNAAPGSPHLHFAVWIAPSAARFWDGENVNPAPLLWGTVRR